MQTYNIVYITGMICCLLKWFAVIFLKLSVNGKCLLIVVNQKLLNAVQICLYRLDCKNVQLSMTVSNACTVSTVLKSSAGSRSHTAGMMVSIYAPVDLCCEVL